MKRKYKSLIIYIIILTVIYIYQYPISISKSYIGYILSSSDASHNKEVSISLNGEFTRNIIKGDTFVGVISIDGVDNFVRNPIASGPKAKMSGIISNIKKEPITVLTTDSSLGYTWTKSYMHLSRDFNMLYGYTHELRVKMNDNDLLIVAPASMVEEANTILEKMIYNK